MQRLVGFVALLAALCCQGQPQRSNLSVPDALADWQDWVLHGRDYLDCSFLHDRAARDAEDFICAWPGRLDLDVESAGGRFAQSWTVLGGEHWVPLPGDADVWPLDVTVDGAAGQVVLRDGTPSLRLGPGAYRVAGRFAWAQRPRTIALPGANGLLRLTVDGVAVALPRQDRGAVWLGQGERQAAVEDALEVIVHRLVEDDVPIRLSTVLRIDAAGSVREALIGPLLPDGFVPLALDSALAARLEPDGNLRVLVRPGSWRLTLAARASTAADSGIVLREPQHNMPASEIWSYRANPALRASVADAARSVDPVLVASPWTGLPAFRLVPGESFSIVERHRGRAEADNQLSLERLLWLDFDGGGFVFADAVRGAMRSGWRLDMAAPYALMSATEAGDSLQVTQTGDAGTAGIELRIADVDVTALGRIDSRGEMPVAGWRSALDSAVAVLHLPPGHKLAAGFGVDAAPTSWSGRWRLLDFFVLLIIAIAALRLFGAVAGGAALLAVALSYHEPGAPVWTWLNLLLAAALARVAPEGRLRKLARGYRIASLVLLLVFLVPFAVSQIRAAIYPQLATEPELPADTFGLFQVLAESRGFDDAVDALIEQRRFPLSGLAFGARAPRQEQVARLEADGVQAMAAKVPPDAAAVFERYDAGAMLQTGPGRPQWLRNAHPLLWSGPVDAERSMRLVVLPAWLVGLLRFVAVAALGLFAAAIALDMFGGGSSLRALPGRLVGWLRRPGQAASTLLLAAFAMLLVAPPAEAATPPAELLEELEERLLAPPECAPDCAEVVAAEVTVGAAELSMRLDVHALDEVAVPLPGSEGGWRPASVTSGERSLAVRRGADDVLRVRLAPGRHRLQLAGLLPPGEVLEIPFPAVPRRIEATAERWSVGGIDDATLTAGSLVLTRLPSPAEGEPSQRPSEWETSRFPVYLSVERTFRLGLDWRMTTMVRRIAPTAGAISLQVPLLEGEVVLSGEPALAGSVPVAFGPRQRVVHWESALPIRSTMSLLAPSDRPWREVWQFAVGSVWQVRFDGVPQSAGGPMHLGERQGHGAAQRVEPRRGSEILAFHPRPGETLAVAIERPLAAPGDTLSFDSVRLDTDVGARLRRSTLALQYRSTRGGSHRIGLPAGARNAWVAIDGREQPLTVVGGAEGEMQSLDLPIEPGEHAVRVSWEEAAEVGFRVQTPQVRLDAPSSNIVASLDMPGNRWLLHTTGPTLGAAVLYWSELLALLVVAVILGRLTGGREPGQAPLGTGHWILLGLGFSTSSWAALGVVVAWLLAHAYLKREEAAPGRPRLVHNALQIGLALLTLAAFAAILTGITSGLLGSPDMHVAGFESRLGVLAWFADQTRDTTPQGSAWSLPIWAYKVLILAWALWLSFALVRWLPWVWQRFALGGLWRGRPPKSEPDAAEAEVAEPAPEGA